MVNISAQSRKVHMPIVRIGTNEMKRVWLMVLSIFVAAALPLTEAKCKELRPAELLPPGDYLLAFTLDYINRELGFIQGTVTWNTEQSGFTFTATEVAEFEVSFSLRRVSRRPDRYQLHGASAGPHREKYLLTGVLQESKTGHILRRCEIASFIHHAGKESPVLTQGKWMLRPTESKFEQAADGAGERHSAP
jgi:hypothetical protein